MLQMQYVGLFHRPGQHRKRTCCRCLSGKFTEKSDSSSRLPRWIEA